MAVMWAACVVLSGAVAAGNAEAGAAPPPAMVPIARSYLGGPRRHRPRPL